jgi:predicted GNAT superfamily acetyltransferase
VTVAAELELRPFDERWLDVVLALNNAHVPAVSRLEPDDLPWYAELADRFVLAVAPERDHQLGPAAGAGSATAAELAGFVITVGPGSAYPSPNYAWFRSRHEQFSYVDRVAVAERFQGRGLGRRLYDEVVFARARERGHDVVCAEVNLRPRNDTSLLFHATLGFTEVGRRVDAEGKLLSMVELRLATSPL